MLSEEKIHSFARMIFNKVGEQQPSVFNKNALNGKMMQWSMSKPELKINMFRLVDVLPSLSSSRSVAEHAYQYLKSPVSDLNLPLKHFLSKNPGFLLSRLTSKVVKFSVKQMANQFIPGRTPLEAGKSLIKIRKAGMAFTVDLLGEYSVSEKEACDYLNRYLQALTDIDALFANRKSANSPIIEGHPAELSPNCVSVKLSALYSQCGPLNFKKSVKVLSQRLEEIASKAKEVSAMLYVDAEDSTNNPIIYKVFTDVFSKKEFLDFPYPGIVIQAYAKNSQEVLNDLINFAKRRQNPIAVRLVKGAYWDQETILSKQQDWQSPLFSNKETSDANFEMLSRILVDNHKHCLPAFASHNIRSLAHACCYAEYKGLSSKDFEIQVLYGMADPIAKVFRNEGFLLRFYVPLGEIIPGMGYLVRRLLENTSNESFLKHTFFDQANTDNLIKKPEFKN